MVDWNDWILVTYILTAQRSQTGCQPIGAGPWSWLTAFFTRAVYFFCWRFILTIYHINIILLITSHKHIKFWRRNKSHANLPHCNNLTYCNMSTKQPRNCQKQAHKGAVGQLDIFPVGHMTGNISSPTGTHCIGTHAALPATTNTHSYVYTHCYPQSPC